MKLAEFNRLKNLVTRAESSNDAEAWAAFRFATNFLHGLGLTWVDVVEKRVVVLNEVEAADPGEIAVPSHDDRKAPTRSEDDLDFEMALSDADGSFRDLLLDIQAQHESGRRLSPRQREIVENAAERAAERHPGGRVR